jgi:hypothetical protein
VKRRHALDAGLVASRFVRRRVRVPVRVPVMPFYTSRVPRPLVISVFGMNTTEITRGFPISHEFADADLGDARRESRLLQIVEAMAGAPSAGFPSMVRTQAESEALYRFLRNEDVNFDAIVEPHIEATRERVWRANEVVVVHDSTDFEFAGADQLDALGYLSANRRGFGGHFSLAVDARRLWMPLGVLAATMHFRDEPPPRRSRKLAGCDYAKLEDKESKRWLEHIERTEELLGGGPAAIHVMDREADAYPLLTTLVRSKRRFVVRLRLDRVARADESAADWEKVSAIVGRADDVLCVEVPIGPRREKTAPRAKKAWPARRARRAKLQFAATRLELRRPHYLRQGFPKALPVNVVRLYEVEAPDGTQPIEWVLLTAEPVDGVEDVRRVVDTYRARWRIEEYFKAIKTGCAYTKRHLESRRTLLNALALTIPVAWQLLLLRGYARELPDAPATAILTDVQLALLREARTGRLPDRNPTVRDALLAVARLGGHLTHSGEPGWQTLGRGMERLLQYEVGYYLALSMVSRSDVRRREK